MAKSTCTGCGQIFGGVWLFDRHRIGEYAKSDGTHSQRGCMTEKQMLEKGFLKNEKGWWIPEVFDKEKIKLIKEKVNTL